MPKVDVNELLRFTARYTGAGLFIAIGWAISVTYVIPHLPMP